MKISGNNYEFNQDRLDMLQASFGAVLEQKDLFSNIIDFFPYHIEVFARDGTTVMINRTMLDEFDIQDKAMVIGKYNKNVILAYMIFAFYAQHILRRAVYPYRRAVR